EHRIELALDDCVLAVYLGGIAAARLHDHHAVHTRCDMFEHHRRAAVIHEHAGIIRGELEADGLSRRDGAVLVLRRHHRRMKVHRMHHRRGRYLHAGHRLVGAVGHRELDAVAHALNFTPGAISMILWVVSIWISFTASATRGFTAASVLSALPAEKAPVWR